MTRAEQIVEALLGGTESFDYSPEDLARYHQLKQQQKEIAASNRMIDPTTGEWDAAWTKNMREFEALRNRYNGMPPKQLSAATRPKATFWATSGSLA